MGEPLPFACLSYILKFIYSYILTWFYGIKTLYQTRSNASINLNIPLHVGGSGDYGYNTDIES
ncbi:hypothetical protein J42TS3_38830 [Paenibacillus vini]|uniref:Uncharacterized protein n=1 Tax=Paenibacillus vini TaxID=1476024 RepID=A0ABQ4MFW8_9BACL|nr:hypothetical protein J42TS3_38830 [Paenibacillus vini]